MHSWRLVGSPFDDGDFGSDDFAAEGLETTRAKTSCLSVVFEFAFGVSELISWIETAWNLFSRKHTVHGVDIGNYIFVHWGIFSMGLNIFYLFLEC